MGFGDMLSELKKKSVSFDVVRGQLSICGSSIYLSNSFQRHQCYVAMGRRQRNMQTSRISHRNELQCFNHNPCSYKLPQTQSCNRPLQFQEWKILEQRIYETSYHLVYLPGHLLTNSTYLQSRNQRGWQTCVCQHIMGEHWKANILHCACNIFLRYSIDIYDCHATKNFSFSSSEHCSNAQLAYHEIKSKTKESC